MYILIKAIILDICNLNADPGRCRGDFPKFFYDRNSGSCRRFRYGGCEGNANRFSSIDECESVCIEHEEPGLIGNKTVQSAQGRPNSKHTNSNEKNYLNM